jgi:DNA invertase Pin-like site-specific DNA recombinase
VAIHRCAIYTRKSSEEGLEQDFNSLDAQRESCEAFILSQKQTGWVALPVMYDDGGISGGTMDRPALQRLLADIHAGRVDTVVVYKVDRLTRSLSDFAKIVDAFDARGVAFVSVTQQFNTTTSMGRLTLNMLLSFAQFEREVTGERIRDKIAASKRKGMWMGGLPPLGYDAVNRKLVVNPAEKETIRHLFRRYAVLKSIRALKEELDESGVVSKVRVNRLGLRTGGVSIARGALYQMLQNRIYRGEIVHKDQHHPGQHEAIIDETLWNEVQASVAESRIEHVTQAHAIASSLLAGIVYDDDGERMSPTRTVKNGRRHHYYVSRSLNARSRTTPLAGACRVRATDLETIIQDKVRALLRDEGVVSDAVSYGEGELNVARMLIEQAANLANRWPCLRPSQKRAILQTLVARISVRSDTVEVSARLATMPAIVADSPRLDPACVAPNEPVTLFSIPVRLRRTGIVSKLLIRRPINGTHREPDRSLLRLLGQARRFHDMVMNSRGKSTSQLAAEAKVDPSYFTRVLRLSFLSPEITQAIVHGRQPPTLTASKLKLASRIATAWTEQRRELGVE